jgi:serine/threonine protein kinase
LYEAPGEPAFISMEYVDGPSLWVLRMQQPQQYFSWDFLKPIVKQMCEALDYAHGEKVIHRDLKPANMLLDERQRLRLADFGIAARDFEPSAIDAHRVGASGTLSYMSPQQIAGAAARVTDDIYALGATLYELLTGHPPFYENNIAYQVRNVAPTPLEERLADLEINDPIPTAVAAMIMACLSKDPEKRPQSARAVEDWIGIADGPAREADDFAATVVVAPETGQSIKETHPPLEDDELPGPEPENSRGVSLRLLLGLAVVAVMGWLAWGRFNTNTSNATLTEANAVNNSDSATSNAAAGLIPVVASAASTNGTAASIELGEFNHESGLRLITGIDDGETSPAAIVGKECRHLDSRTRARCYFQILPAFKHSGLMNAKIQVEYYAETRGALQLQFDGAAPRQTLHYTGGGRADFEGGGGWKTATFQVDGALFRGGERGGADFRVSTLCPDVYVRSVTVTLY